MAASATNLWRRGWSAALVALVFVALVPTESGAYHRRRYDELQDRIDATREKIRDAQRRERDLLGQIEESDQRRAGLEANLATIGDQLGAAQARLAITNARLDRVSAELALKTQELEHTLGALEDQTHQLNSRATQIYILGPIDHSMIVLGAKDLHSIVAGEQYAKSVFRADSLLLDKIRLTKERVEAARAVIQQKKKEIEAVARSQEEEAARIAAIRNEHASAKAEIDREINYRERLLRQVRDQKEAYRRAIRSWEQESSNILAYLQGAQSGQGSYSGGRRGYFKWPLRGSITSDYGWRTHPVHGERSFHTGIDIDGDTGDTVRAGRAGEVLYTGYKGAFGLIVLLDHGSSIASMYAHLSNVYVRPGDRVRTGESVGAVGCTGWCTGSHLHFEVRVNGNPQNPRAWL